MSNANKEKTKQLGMPFGTACGRLRKQLLFHLAEKLGATCCRRCGRRIVTAEELSIEHVQPWLHSDDPVGLFFDIKNVAFSHRSCNLNRSQLRRPSSIPETHSWCHRCDRVMLKAQFHKNSYTKTGVKSTCKQCCKERDYFHGSREARKERGWGHGNRKANRTGVPARV